MPVNRVAGSIACLGLLLFINSPSHAGQVETPDFPIISTIVGPANFGLRYQRTTTSESTVITISSLENTDESRRAESSSLTTLSVSKRSLSAKLSTSFSGGFSPTSFGLSASGESSDEQTRTEKNSTESQKIREYKQKLQTEHTNRKSEKYELLPNAGFLNSNIEFLNSGSESIDVSNITVQWQMYDPDQPTRIRHQLDLKLLEPKIGGSDLPGSPTATTSPTDLATLTIPPTHGRGSGVLRSVSLEGISRDFVEEAIQNGYAFRIVVRSFTTSVGGQPVDLRAKAANFARERTSIRIIDRNGEHSFFYRADSGETLESALRNADFAPRVETVGGTPFLAELSDIIGRNPAEKVDLVNDRVDDGRWVVFSSLAAGWAKGPLQILKPAQEVIVAFITNYDLLAVDPPVIEYQFTASMECQETQSTTKISLIEVDEVPKQSAVSLTISGFRPRSDSETLSASEEYQRLLPNDLRKPPFWVLLAPPLKSTFSRLGGPRPISVGDSAMADFQIQYGAVGRIALGKMEQGTVAAMSDGSVMADIRLGRQFPSVTRSQDRLTISMEQGPRRVAFGRKIIWPKLDGHIAVSPGFVPPQQLWESDFPLRNINYVEGRWILGNLSIALPLSVDGDRRLRYRALFLPQLRSDQSATTISSAVHTTHYQIRSESLPVARMTDMPINNVASKMVERRISGAGLPQAPFQARPSVPSMPEQRPINDSSFTKFPSPELGPDSRNVCKYWGP